MNSENFKMNIQISSNILNNSFDLLYPTIEIFNRFDGKMFSVADDKELKGALITVTTSIELLLKSKIASIDWTQLFQRHTEADKNKLLRGDFDSVNFNKCLTRLESISQIKFSDKTKSDINKIREIRNKITHFHFDTKCDEFISLISVGLDIFIEFYRNYIFIDLCEDKDRTKEIDNELKGIKKYVNTRIMTLNEKFKTSDRPKTFYFCECSNCLQDAFIIKDKNTVKCIFCGHEDNINWIAEIHSNFNGNTRHCPKCKFHSMTAIHSKEDEKEAWDCVICGHFINKPRQWSNSLDNSISTDSIKEEFRLTN